ncbi:MAG: prepilin-type N-terminal cleavage/methylation domain-containing protein [bacterium]|nr:prepilin-type N-terminal cleavage/methylation domain-containing protein [bacterium]
MMRRAFTLVEVLIVVIVLSILAAAILPQFTEAADESRIGTTAIIVKSMQRQLTVEKARDGTWPTAFDATWFEGGVLPNNPYDPDQTDQIQVTNSATMLHPTTKTVGDYGSFWYNYGNGIVRARVLAGVDTAATIKVYNSVNGTKITTLSQTD